MASRGRTFCSRSFDPRPRARGGGPPRHDATQDKVSIRAPVRGAAHRGRLGPVQHLVSIRAPVRGAARSWAPPQPSYWLFRSAPPCEGRRWICAVRWTTRRFDPRPRARGGAPGSASHFPVALVLIRAPVRGAAFSLRLERSLKSCFDPRPRARGGPASAPGYDPLVFRSAPPCEGRPQSAGLSPGWRSFDPRPRARGGTLWDERPGTSRVSFDPRPRARGGPDGCRSTWSRFRFDPRPRARGGSTRLQWRMPSECFDPRPRARGGDKIGKLSTELYEFRSAPPCEGRLIAFSMSVLMSLFRSAPPCEGRRVVGNDRCQAQEFRSAPPCEGRRQPWMPDRRAERVSIRAPVRGAASTRLQWRMPSECFDPRPRARGGISSIG